MTQPNVPKTEDEIMQGLYSKVIGINFYNTIYSYGIDKGYDKGYEQAMKDLDVLND